MFKPVVLAASLALLGNLAHAQTLPVVAELPLRAHLAFLADDLLEGRGTGQRGGDLAVRYLETQAALIGLQPLKDGTYRQGLTIVGSKALPGSSVAFSAGGQTLAPKFGEGIVFGASNGQPKVAFDAPVVFAGYGINAPDERWDDYKGADLKGKLVIMMVNDPQPTATEPNRFAGKSLTWYGRWVYKYEEALRQGAAGVLLIHTTESASYPWSVPANGFGHERFSLAGSGNAMEGWLQEDTARALFKAAGQDLDALRAQAETREFKPVALDATVHVKLDSTIRKVEQFNVAGIVPGTDPKLKDQAVIYSAHWDHLGKDDEGSTRAGQSDHIYNGAIDNASGAAALLAMAQVAVKHPARRTQIFLWPAGEETGMLGANAYVRAPLWPLAKTAADLNLDSMNFVGKTRDIGVAGAERSSLYASAAKVAKRMGLRLAPAIPDLSGAFYRADHFAFAKAGIPAFNVGSAVFSGDGSFDFVNDPQGSSARLVAFKKDYHQLTDEYNPAWDLSGMVQQAQFTLNLGYEVANDKAMPTWNKGEAFGEVKR
ncbi:M28 family peptidase [Janthinobacterium aquaticum]|uniref:M28 family peptidase n=1 Tax=Janthinobacterium sp. FT58W TaxID=2654254 RepID=UPI001264CBD3|nr:M28 family peptidase [Janthinobacterium sp. FT58W]KAB8042095.1 M28 family peptidase [Janthinobacterium sp. FT58W]